MGETPSRDKSGCYLSSGNPSGRPKGARNQSTVLKEIAHEACKAHVNGERKNITVYEAVLYSLVKAASAGNTIARDFVLERIRQLQPEPSDSEVGVAVMPAPMTMDEWEAAAEERNKKRTRPPTWEDFGADLLQGDNKEDS